MAKITCRNLKNFKRSLQDIGTALREGRLPTVDVVAKQAASDWLASLPEKMLEEAEATEAHERYETERRLTALYAADMRSKSPEITSTVLLQHALALQQALNDALLEAAVTCTIEFKE